MSCTDLPTVQKSAVPSLFQCLGGPCWLLHLSGFSGVWPLHEIIMETNPCAFPPQPAINTMKNKEENEHSECTSAPCLEELNPNSFNFDTSADFTKPSLLSIFIVLVFFFLIWWLWQNTKPWVASSGEWDTDVCPSGVFISHVVSCVVLFKVRDTALKGRGHIPPWLSSHRDRGKEEKKIPIWRFHTPTADSSDSLSTFPLLPSAPPWRWWPHTTPVLWKPGNAPTSHEFLMPKAAQEVWGAQPWAPRAVPHGQPLTTHPRVMWGTRGWQTQLPQHPSPPTALHSSPRSGT